MTMEISSAIKYIGVDDLDIDLFESQYVVPEGMAIKIYVSSQLEQVKKQLKHMHDEKHN